MSLDVTAALSAMTVPEKASLLSGVTFWDTAAVERVGVPSVMVADGPHGLRKEVRGADGVTTTVPATCFPPAVTLGSTWDADLVRRVGAALGRESRAEGVAVLLGPGINIKRSPLCGRNFEYLSEDPLVSGVLGAALVDGIQSEGVGASVKHFAANNQETDRLRVSADVDERTLREIYLPAFERVVVQARPWTVMCAYNRVNGVHASQHPWLLTTVLREEWGFDGLVVSDWGAVHDRVAALEAGLDLQMPSPGGRTNAEVVEAVTSGRVPEATLDRSARRALDLVARAQAGADVDRAAGPDLADHHALAREAAAAGAVLLRNEVRDGAPLLPLDPGADVLVVGELARTPRFQGAGSSQVAPTQVEDVLDQLRTIAGGDVAFAPGYDLHGQADAAALRDEAVAAASGARTVVAVVGLPPADESEGYDRTHLDLPATQAALLAGLGAVTERLVVVLVNGSAVAVGDWDHHAGAVLETWLGGQAGGGAVAELLLGRRSPQGRLAETIPRRLEDTPAYGSFPGELGHSRYGEGVLVGYRWYDTRRLEVAYPFGHGLTYTTFAHDGLTADVSGEGQDVRLDVRTHVTNTGDRAGVEVVQLYVADPDALVRRPDRELRAFARVDLEPGETREVAWTLDARALAYWHPERRRWTVEGGTFTLAVGSSSRDLSVSVDIQVVGEDLARPLDEWSTVTEALADPERGDLARRLLGGHATAMMGEFTLGALADFAGAGFDHDDLATLLGDTHD